MREAGKTLPNAIGEVREAVDFCRYYAACMRGAKLPALMNRGPSDRSSRISPWNFPLAIFVGQVSAALAAGNPVLAKPAEQTPLMAAAAVRLFHRAGVPRAALQLLPGPGETIGAALVADPRIAGVIFTGSTEVARLINRQLARARRRAGADRRDRRPERDDRRQFRAAGAGGCRRAGIGVRQRGPALFGAARAVRAGRHCRHGASRCWMARCASSRSATRAGSRPISGR